jgi:drug/metabolite transporter (DMT)-like permease
MSILTKLAPLGQADAMVSLIVHAVLGLAVIGIIVASNPAIFRQPATPKVSVLEAVYYVAGVASVVIGYYFNIRFIGEYAPRGSHNPFWGPGSWAEFMRLGYVNPAAASASEDYTIASVIVLPLFTIVDGRRRGVRRSWLYFLLVLTASTAFALAFYLATAERQRRLTAASPGETAVRAFGAEHPPA